MVASIDGLTDEIGSEADDGEERDTLHDSHGRVGVAQGAESWVSSHLGNRMRGDQGKFWS